jgi:dolichol-phosphate mannosyltransferase
MFLRLKTKLRSTLAGLVVKAYSVATIQTKMRTLVALMAENTKPVILTTIEGITQKTFSETILMIPTLNEEEAIETLVVEAKNCGFTRILVVDGFSSDRTRDVAAKSGASVVEQEFGKGKGCGVRTGMKRFLEEKADFLCIIDGDGTNIPSHLRDMISALQAGEADVVLGSRTRGSREPHAMNWLSLTSNRTVSFLLGAKFGRLFTDVQTGYWAFTRDAVQRIYPKVQSTGFEIELEMFVKILKEGFRVSEVPVGFRRRKGTTKFSFKLRIRNLYYALKFLSQ